MKIDAAFNVKLVEVVEKFPVLYNFKLKGYSNRNEVDREWAKVAKEVNESVENCKEAWRNIRIAFTRSLKTKSGRAAKKKYYLTDQLQFVLPYLNCRKESLPGNLPSPGYIEENENAVADPAPATVVDASLTENTHDDNQNAEPCISTMNPLLPTVPLKKRKPVDPVDECFMEFINLKKAASQPAENTRKLFLLSLQSDVDEMTAAQFRLFKRKVGLLVEEILSANDELSLPSRTPSLRTSSSHSAEFYTHTPTSPSPRSGHCSTGTSPLHYSTYSSTPNPTTPAYDGPWTVRYQYDQPGQFNTVSGGTDFFGYQELDLTAPQRTNT